MNRRDFIKFSSLVLFSTTAFAKSDSKLFIKLPPKKLNYYHIKGKQKGGRVLLIGGIHGNEIGAYKASDLLIDSEITKGELLIIPRTNFTSILANVRGYNGDMNRKFENISKQDPDYYYVEALKNIILSYKPDVVISMHDGYGFANKNKRAWGQSIVIDEIVYKNFKLYKNARFVMDEANKIVKNKISIINTKTFSGFYHQEQKKALTGWCLKNGIEAYCIEASKQLESLEDKIYTHFAMLKGFFELYKIEIKNFDDIAENINKYLILKKPRLVLDINGRKIEVKNREILKVKRGSVIEVTEIDGHRGDYLVPRGVNLNWRSFHFSNLNFDIKRDYEKIFSINIKRI